MIFFFFSSRRRHTRFDCDWSSDVCSSDLRWGCSVARLSWSELGQQILYNCGENAPVKVTHPLWGSRVWRTKHKEFIRLSRAGGRAEAGSPFAEMRSNLAMRGEPWTKGWGGKGAVIAAVLLTMMVGCCMVGFCTFSHVSDGFDGHGGSLDLCAAMLGASVTLG